MSVTSTRHFIDLFYRITLTDQKGLEETDSSFTSIHVPFSDWEGRLVELEDDHQDVEEESVVTSVDA